MMHVNTVCLLGPLRWSTPDGPPRLCSHGCPFSSNRFHSASNSGWVIFVSLWLSCEWSGHHLMGKIKLRAIQSGWVFFSQCTHTRVVADDEHRQTKHIHTTWKTLFVSLWHIFYRFSRPTAIRNEQKRKMSIYVTYIPLNVRGWGWEWQRQCVFVQCDACIAYMLDHVVECLNGDRRIRT